MRPRRAVAALSAGTLLLVGLSACTPSTACATPACRASPGPTVVVTPLPTDGPTVPLDTLGTGDLTHRLARARRGSIVQLPSGTTDFTDFTPTQHASFVGVDVADDLLGIEGSSDGSTRLRIEPMSSTRAGEVPTTFPESIRIGLLRIEAPTRFIRNLTVVGTDQGHSYNGLSVAQTTNALISDVTVLAVPGDDHAPPGETFGIDDYKTRGSVYRDVTVDGEGVGAAGFGGNNSSDLTLESCTFTGNRYSAGATFWQVDGVTLTHVTARGNGHYGLNFERVGGRVEMTAPVIADNGGADIRIASDFGSATYEIRDPVLEGGRLHVVLPPTYDGHPNLQRAADIHVIVGGVDRTSAVLVVTQN